MASANELIAGALRVISSLSPGEAVPGAEADNALTVLNMMLASWSADNLMVPYRTLESFTLTVGQSSYTIGTGANFDTTRPDYVTGCFRRDANNLDFQLIPLTKEQYNGVMMKDLQGAPQWYFYDPQYPNGIIYLYPADILAETLYVESLKPVNQFTNLQTTMALPGEYQEAIKYLLAKRLAPEYGFAITPDLMRLMDDAEARIMRKNIRPKAANFDLMLQRPAPYNIYNG